MAADEARSAANAQPVEQLELVPFTTPPQPRDGLVTVLRFVESNLDYDGEESRFAVYSVGRGRRRVAETSLDGIGRCLQVLQEEGELAAGTRIGVLDRRERTWLVSPFGGGD